MSNIIEFPTKAALDSTFLQREIESLLLEKGASEETINFAKERVAHWLEFGKDDGSISFAVDFGSVSRDEAEAIGDKVQSEINNLCKKSHSIISSLKAQLILKEIKIFQLESLNE